MAEMADLSFSTNQLDVQDKATCQFYKHKVRFVMFHPLKLFVSKVETTCSTSRNNINDWSCFMKCKVGIVEKIRIGS